MGGTKNSYERRFKGKAVEIKNNWLNGNRRTRSSEGAELGFIANEGCQG